jgi:hypothetical protein
MMLPPKPIRGKEQLVRERNSTVVRIDERVSVRYKVDKLAQRSEQQSHEMKGIQSRKASDREIQKADSAFVDEIRILPVEDEPGYYPKHLNGGPSIFIKRTK